MSTPYMRPIQDGSEYNTLTHQMLTIVHRLDEEYIYDKMDLEHMLDELTAKVQNLRDLFELPKSDKPDNLDASPFLHNSVTFRNTHGNPVTVELDSSGNPVESDESDDSLKEGNLRDLSDLRVVTQYGQILQNGDQLRDARDPVDKPWKYESVTHPRKLNVYRKADENGPNYYPNRDSREFYANVFDLGIWDIRYRDWTFRPGWPETYIARVEAGLRNM